MHDAFCEGFSRRDVDGLRALFLPSDDVMVVTSEDAVLHDRAEWEQFLTRYSHGSTTYSWEWERRAVAGRTHWHADGTWHDDVQVTATRVS